MALSAFVGSTTQRATNGTTAVSGLGFQPKVLILFWSNQTADGGGAGVGTGLGFACDNGGVTNQVAAWGVSGDNLTDTAVGCRVTNADCVTIINPAMTLLGEADVASWDADGFTLNWTSVDGTQRIINFLALGGSDITNCAAGATARPTAAGNQGVTAPGFTPKCLLTACPGERLTTIPSNGNVDGGLMAGWALSSTARGLCGWSERNARTTGDGQCYQRTVRCAAAPGAGVIAEADFVSFDANGFTLNWTTVNTRAGYYVWLCLGGADLSFAQGAFNCDTDLGPQAVTGVGFQPQALLLASFGKAAATTSQTENRWAFGAAAGATQRATLWAGGDSGAATTDCSSILDRDEVLTIATPGHGTPTLDGSADLTSFDSDGFTLDWTDASPVAAQALYLAVKGAAAAPDYHLPSRVMMSVP